MGSPFERVWKIGGRLEYFVRNAATTGEFIKVNKIHPLEGLELPGAELVRPESAGRESLAVRGPSFPGGMRVPHLHFENKVYLVTDEQWKKFVGQALKEFQAKLGRVGVVTFDNFMSIADAVDQLVG